MKTIYPGHATISGSHSKCLMSQNCLVGLYRATPKVHSNRMVSLSQMNNDELTNEREESGACSSYPERGGRRRSQFAQSLPWRENEEASSIIIDNITNTIIL